MADIFSTLRAWSGTDSANKPQDSDVIGSGLGPNLRAIQAVIKNYLAGQSSTVSPSAGVADLTTATGHWVPISGNSTITGFGTEAAGIEYIVTFTGTPPLIHNSTSFILPGAATVQAAAGDACVAESLGSGNWKIWGYSKANGTPIVGSSFTAGSTATLNPVSATVAATAHNLGSTPDFVQWYLENLSTELGFSAGDRVPMFSNNGVIGVAIDATNVTILCSGTPNILRKDTGAIATITLSKWKFVAVPYKKN